MVKVQEMSLPHQGWPAVGEGERFSCRSRQYLSSSNASNLSARMEFNERAGLDIGTNRTSPQIKEKKMVSYPVSLVSKVFLASSKSRQSIRTEFLELSNSFTQVHLLQESIDKLVIVLWRLELRKYAHTVNQLPLFRRPFLFQRLVLYRVTKEKTSSELWFKP